MFRYSYHSLLWYHKGLSYHLGGIHLALAFCANFGAHESMLQLLKWLLMLLGLSYGLSSLQWTQSECS